MKHTLLIGLFAFATSIALSQEDFFKAEDLKSNQIRAINFTGLDNNQELVNNTEITLNQVKKDGFNTIKLEVNLKQLVRNGKYPYLDPKAYALIDTLSSLASLKDLKIILSLKTQSSELKENPRDSYWTDHWTRLGHIYVWRKIAAKYKDNRTIIGYDILPTPTARVKSIQFTYVANQLISAIRSEDKNHLVFVNGLNKYLTDWSGVKSLRLRDNNIALSGKFNYKNRFRYQKTAWSNETRRRRYKTNDMTLKSIFRLTGNLDSLSSKFDTPVFISEWGMGNKAFRKWRNGHKYYTLSRIVLDSKHYGHCVQSLNGDTFGLYKFKNGSIKHRKRIIKKTFTPNKVHVKT